MTAMTERDLAELRRTFERARVPLRFAADRHVAGVGAGTLLMDIRRAPGVPAPGEAFTLRPGRAHVSITAIDAKRRQLVLVVEEDERIIRTWHRRRRRWNTTIIPKDVRRFLVGMDEQHLFVALLQGAPRSVPDAHRALMPRAVAGLAATGARVPRQGEHFFLPAEGAERAAIDHALAAGVVPRRAAVVAHRDGVPIARAGKPHVASESLVVLDRQFVRGVVRHPDHHPLRLRDWARPEVNTEADARLAGMKWVD